MEKYNLLPEQLLYEGTLSPENFFTPDPLADHWILTAHDSEYLGKLVNQTLSKSEVRAIGFPLSPELVRREIQIAGGSVQAAVFALTHGIGMNIAGGTHHAFTDRGEGFCLLNDLAITAKYLLENKLANRVLIVDLDVHQGNGTAQIFKGSRNVFTLSIHGEKNYPHRKEQSHCDIALPDKTGDAAYLNILENSLPRIVEEFRPDFILYQCGVDVLESDQLGRMSLTLGGVKERDRLVLALAKKHQIPMTCCMGGGYSKKIKDIIDAHAQVFRLAQELYF
jgi:acetoin utilization deacetylase AcuC-like enzyme